MHHCGWEKSDSKLRQEDLGCAIMTVGAYRVGGLLRAEGLGI